MLRLNLWVTALASGIVCATVLAAAEGQPQAAPPSIGGKFPGGAATSKGGVDNRNAFSHSSGNLSFAQEFDFKIGNAIFRKLWVSSPASTRSSDGLGPLYNARSCQRCHLKDGRGHPPAANWPDDNAVSMMLKLSIPPASTEDRTALATGRAAVIPEPTYGTQLQDLAIQGHSGEGRIHVTYVERTVTLAGGESVRLRAPHYAITHLTYGPLHPKTMLSPRIAPQMIGLGLLEAIPAKDILALADPDDRDGDGISGRASRVWSLASDSLVLGRFGWKAGAADVLEQAVHAFSNDMGLSTRLLPHVSGECTRAQEKCRSAPHGASDNQAEVPDNLLRLVVFYARNLAVPPRRNANALDVQRGGEIFQAIGCAGCHAPSHRTGQSAVSAHLSNQTIWPYTDLLLHDMGDGLADNRPEGREWRTAPLWGVGLTGVVSGHTNLLHDGRARNVKEAILWHGGEASASRDRFQALEKAQRDALIAFINSL